MLLGRFLHNAAKKCSLYRRKDSQIYQHTGGEHLLRTGSGARLSTGLEEGAAFLARPGSRAHPWGQRWGQLHPILSPGVVNRAHPKENQRAATSSRGSGSWAGRTNTWTPTARTQWKLSAADTEKRSPLVCAPSPLRRCCLWYFLTSLGPSPTGILPSWDSGRIRFAGLSGKPPNVSPLPGR